MKFLKLSVTRLNTKHQMKSSLNTEWTSSADEVIQLKAREQASEWTFIGDFVSGFQGQTWTASKKFFFILYQANVSQTLSCRAWNPFYLSVLLHLTSLHQMMKHYPSIKPAPSSLSACLITPQTWKQRKPQKPRHPSSRFVTSSQQEARTALPLCSFSSKTHSKPYKAS